MNLLILAAALLGGETPSLPPAAPGYEWQPFRDGDPTQIKLMYAGEQVGIYRFADDAYFPLDPRTRRFGPQCAPPIEPPNRTNYGVAPDRIRAGEHYRHAGAEIDREQARGLVGGDGDRIPDVSKKWRVVVIGPERERVLRDFDGDPALAPWKDRVVVQGYEPTHYHVARTGYCTTGKPTIYVLQPDGTVLHRQDDYAGGAAALAEALRKADPDYKPKNDPDRRKPELPFSIPLTLKVPWSAWALAGAAVLLVLVVTRKKVKP
jgi:hypothetical protein